MLFARKSPVLGVETIGPRRIAVGKEAIYEVRIQNAGQIAADDAAVFVELPGWADVHGSQVTAGTTDAPASGG